MVAGLSWSLHNLHANFSTFMPASVTERRGLCAMTAGVGLLRRAVGRRARLRYDHAMTRVLFLCGVLALGAGAPAAHAQPVPDTMAQRTVACIGCHGDDGRAASDGYYPRIAGKPAGYLYNQLLNFRDGRRSYPMMVYMVSHLSDEYLREMAGYFSSLHPPYPPPQRAQASPAALARGRQLALEGDRGADVPACVACHGQALTGIAPAIPGLLGLPRDYLSAQFGAWKNGARRAAQPDCMATLAQRLSVDDISAVSAWLSQQPAPSDARPLSGSRVRLPLECGSVQQAGEGHRR